ncbi:MAG TPA: MEDS domain-containing protein [Planctomycetota bacterium]|jgi:hypothetical protein|nr:MEDS domain-containing protein [Planctomycetota bacterium]
MDEGTESGIPGVGNLPWGTHLVHFFRTKEDLARGLVGYFKAGLRGAEKILWGTASPLRTDEALSDLSLVVPDFARFLKAGQIVAVDHREWLGGKDPVAGLLEEADGALKSGFRGLRMAGNCSWIGPERHESFMAYEGLLGQAIRGRRILALCSYNLSTGSARDAVEAIRRHDFSLHPGDDSWELLETGRR